VAVSADIARAHFNGRAAYMVRCGAVCSNSCICFL
jgi:hypothetical protein